MLALPRDDEQGKQADGVRALKPLFILPVPPSLAREEFQELMLTAGVKTRGCNWHGDGRCSLWVELEPLQSANASRPLTEKAEEESAKS